LTLAQVSEAAKKRVALIAREFTEGFEFLKNYPRSVTIFGSTRTKEGSHYFEKARELSRRIVEELRYSVTTGGGPGIMGAANQGAFEGGGNSIGITIELPHRQISNKYITDNIGFHYFFSRKVCLAFSAEAYIFFPGGYGTLDEFMEILTLVQTEKIPRIPIILFGKKHWGELEKFFKNVLLKERMIDEADLALYTITEDDDEVIKIIREAPVRIGMEYHETVSEKDTPPKTVARPISELLTEGCEGCEGNNTPLTQSESKKYLKEVNDWQLIEDKEIKKTYIFEDFKSALAFMNDVGRIAEDQGHHPDMKIHDYRKVDVRISTHAISGLSENDFILASKIDDLTRQNADKSEEESRERDAPAY